MAKFDKIYREGLKRILVEGNLQEDRNRKGVSRLSIPSFTLRHLAEDGFPALTLRKVFPKLAWAELSMFLSGSTDIRDLWSRGVNFWDKDVSNFHNLGEDGLKRLKEANFDIEGSWSDMGKIYPYQYRNFGGKFDQIKWLIQEMKENPLSSRMVVTAWNPLDIPEACLPSCHYGFQIVSRKLRETEKIVDLRTQFEDGYLEATLSRNIELNYREYGFEVHWQQRSTDYLLGTSLNSCFYYLLGMLLEKLTGYKFLAVQGDLKNVHLYDNAIEAAKEMLKRDVNITPPTVSLVGELDIDNLNNENFKMEGYNHQGELKVEMLSYEK